LKRYINNEGDVIKKKKSRFNVIFIKQKKKNKFVLISINPKCQQLKKHPGLFNVSKDKI